MNDEKVDYGLQQFNAGDLLKRFTVTQVFRALDDACNEQQKISENSYETRFTTRVKLVKGLLWKYTPPEIRKAIGEIYVEMGKELKEIDGQLSEKNKQLTQTKISYEYNIEVFLLLEVVLTNSPISVEFAEMEVSGDFKDLIKAIRTPEPVKLFATEVS